MITMDVFRGDAFSAIELTTAIQDIPYVPGFLGSLNLFTPKPVRTTSIMVEKRGAKLNVIQTTERGAPRPRRERNRRNVRNFNTVRLAESDKLMADELQGIRAFGSENELEAVQTEVGNRMADLSQDLDLTFEVHRMGAINGVLLDADGSVIYDYFDEFGISPPTEIAFNWGSRTGVKKFIAENVKRPMLRALGGRALPGMGILALCGDEFYDNMQENAEYRATYLQTSAARELRNDTTFDEIFAWGVRWVNYRGTDDDSTLSVGSTKCKFIPTNVRNVFEVAYSPAEGLPFVNTRGLERYSQTIIDPSGRQEFVDIDVASYPLHICTTPEALLNGRTGA